MINLSTSEPLKNLDPLKQFDKKIGEEERIRKDQYPAGNSLGIDLYFSSLFCFMNTENLFTAHLLPLWTPYYQSSNLFFTTLRNVKPPKTISQIINKLEKANSLTGVICRSF